MSRETLTHLNADVLVGYTDKRGHAWHYRASEQGAESNHYAGAIPVADVRRRLFGWSAVEGELTATALTPDGVIVTRSADRKAIMRSDTGAILGIFSQSYRVHDYDQWLIHNVENILDADLMIGSAGLLRGGAQAWVQIEMADTLTAPAGVEFRPFLTACTSLDGSLATTYMTGVQVVVCDNTLSAALGDRTSRVKVKHSSRSLTRIQSVRDALGIVHETADAFSAQVAALIDETVSADRWDAFVSAWAFGADADTSSRAKAIGVRKTGEINNLWQHDDRVSPWRGTAFGVVQAVNTHTHHLGTVRGVSRVERNAERAITGGVDKMDAETLALLATV